MMQYGLVITLLALEQRAIKVAIKVGDVGHLDRQMSRDNIRRGVMTMFELLLPRKDRKCDFCGSNNNVYVIKVSNGDKWAYCKNCRKDLHLDRLVKELKTSIVFLGGKEDA